MNVLIVGGGKLVYFIGRTFIAKGYTVSIINRNREECSKLARRLKATVIYGEGSDLNILEEAGASTVDTVLAVTPRDEDNLIVCQLAGLRFQVPRTIAMVNDPDNEEVFRKLGVMAVSTTRILTSIIEQRTGFEEIINLMPVGEGKVNVTEIVLGEGSPVVGRLLREFELPDNSLIATIIRGDQAIVPRWGTALYRGDRLIVITVPENHAGVIRMLTGDKR